MERYSLLLIIRKKGSDLCFLSACFEKTLGKYQAISWDTFTHNVYAHPLKLHKSIGFKEIEQWVMITGNIKEVLKRLSQQYI